MSHTPGPWLFQGNDICASDGTHVVCFGHDYDDYGGIMARVSLLRDDSPHPRWSDEWYAEYRAEQTANAILIAAAPDLLAALKAILAERPELWGDGVRGGVTDFPIDEAALFAADAAIAKAEGRS